MDLKYLTDNFAVTGQISVDQLATAKEQGFATVVCNRPDGEAPDQPLSSDIAQACNDAGLMFHYIPMNGPNFTAEDVANLQNAIGSAKGKVLAFCRTGNRSSILWNAVNS